MKAKSKNLNKKNTNTKITLQLPKNLLKQARLASGKGITKTVCQGLQLVAASKAYSDLRNLKGKINLSINLNELRKD